MMTPPKKISQTTVPKRLQNRMLWLLFIATLCSSFMMANCQCNSSQSEGQLQDAATGPDQTTTGEQADAPAPQDNTQQPDPGQPETSTPDPTTPDTSTPDPTKPDATNPDQPANPDKPGTREVPPVPDKTNPPEQPPADQPPGPYGLTKRVANTRCKLPGEPDSLTSMKLVRTFSNLRFSRPLFITYPNDGSNRLFLVEQGGKIYVFKNQPTTRTRTVFLDLSKKVSRRSNEEGLLGLAFHPNYKTNGYFYVYYSRGSGSAASVVSRFKVSKNNADQADANSELKLMEFRQPYRNHNGGMIAFGKDGYLYISSGDGGSGGDPHNHSQNLGTILGNILRIDVDSKSTGKQYGIPKDNPFVNRKGALPEIWAYGLRNVWRFSFDRLTNVMWAGDVGQTTLEEIDIIVKGGNYGWRRMEGTRCYNPRSNCKQPGMILPVIEHARADARSITGGYVYRGKKIPNLFGAYVYGDYVTGKIWALRYDGKKVTQHKLLTNSFKNIASFAEDQNGEMFVVAFDGYIYNLAPATGTGQSKFPQTLTATGCFTSLKTLTPSPGLIPYDVNVPLWSDGLEKIRWIALPGTSKIKWKKEGAWELPEGSVIIKHFAYNKTRGNAKTRHHVETRFLVKYKGDWKGYTYLWNAAQTEAFLLSGTATQKVEQRDAQNKVVSSFTHEVPSRSDCLQCHTSASGRLLGLDTRQMNRNFKYGSVTDNQLRSMNYIKLFEQPLPSAHGQLPAFASISDKSKSVALRARAYLHANCSFCHRPGVSGTADTDLRFETPLSKTKTCNATPKENLGNASNKILVPKQPDRSTLYLRANRRDIKKMPPIGSQLIDKEAMAVLRAWIQGISSCP